MEWINSLAREVLSGSLIVAAMAAGFVCWRTRSLHAVYMRVLHLFVPMEHIKCPVINECISDKSSVIAFRMAYGIQCRTLKDAKAVSAFAVERNIPLDLIGEVGYRFDTLNLRMRSEKDRAGVWFALSPVVILACIACVAMSLLVAFNSNLLISLKKTDTWYWIGTDEAQSLRRDAQWEPFVLTRTQCSSERVISTLNDATAIRDLAILCEVWADSDLKSYLKRELPKQRSAFLVVSLLIGGLGLMLFLELLSWFAEKELRRLIRGDGKQDRMAPA